VVRSFELRRTIIRLRSETGGVPGGCLLDRDGGPSSQGLPLASPGWPGDLRTRQPSGDRAVVLRFDSVEDDAAVGQAPNRANQALLRQQAKLARRGRAAKADLRGELRWPPRPNGEERDDSAPRGIGQELDTGTVA
jgi:hypothetical protein